MGFTCWRNTIVRQIEVTMVHQCTSADANDEV